MRNIPGDLKELSFGHQRECVVARYNSSDDSDSEAKASKKRKRSRNDDSGSGRRERKEKKSGDRGSESLRRQSTRG